MAHHSPRLGAHIGGGALGAPASLASARTAQHAPGHESLWRVWFTMELRRQTAPTLLPSRLQMEVRHADLATSPEPAGAVVVIDVLRSFTTAAYAFAAGARAIYPVEKVEHARALGAALPSALTMGAAAGGWPIPGFDLTNSPAALRAHDLRGKELIHCTAGGVQAVSSWRGADFVFAASLVCARATAREIRRIAPSRLTLVITGKWTDRDGDEDFACADYIEALLEDETADPAPFEARVRRSDFGRRFTGAPSSAHPADDLECCAIADQFDFALQVVRRGDRLTLQPVG